MTAPFDTPPSILYKAAVEGSRHLTWNATHIRAHGLAPPADDVITLWGNPNDAQQGLAGIIGARGQPVLVFAVDISGLAVSRYPPIHLFIDVRGDAWFCTDTIAPERFTEYVA